MLRRLIKRSSRIIILFLKILKFLLRQKIWLLKFWLLILRKDLLWIKFLNMSFSTWGKLFQNLCLTTLLHVLLLKLTSNNSCQMWAQIQHETPRTLITLVRLLQMVFSQQEERKTLMIRVQKKTSWSHQYLPKLKRIALYLNTLTIAQSMELVTYSLINVMECSLMTQQRYSSSLTRIPFITSIEKLMTKKIRFSLTLRMKFHNHFKRKSLFWNISKVIFTQILSHRKISLSLLIKTLISLWRNGWEPNMQSSSDFQIKSFKSSSLTTLKSFYIQNKELLLMSISKRKESISVWHRLWNPQTTKWPNDSTTRNKFFPICFKGNHFLKRLRDLKQQEAQSEKRSTNSIHFLK